MLKKITLLSSISAALIISCWKYFDGRFCTGESLPWAMEEVSRCVAVCAVPPIPGLRAQIARKLHKRGVIDMEVVGTAEVRLVLCIQV